MMGGQWPSKISVGFGTKNVLVCDAMIEKRGEGGNSFLAGSSKRNQRIERMWSDVWNVDFRFIVYILCHSSFYTIEDGQLFTINNPFSYENVI